MRRFAFILLAGLLLLFTLLWLSAAAVHPRIYVEHGPMENFQAVCLLVGCAVFAWRTRAARQPDERVLLGALALFYATFFVREFDTRQFGRPLVDAIMSGTGRNLWLGAGWVVVAYFAFRYRRSLFEVTRKWLRSPAGRLLLLAGVFWVVAAAVDKMDPFGSKPRDMLTEELLEANAALIMALAAVVDVKYARSASCEAAAGVDQAPARNSLRA